MQWAKDFYSKQREWFKSSAYWSQLTVSDPPGHARRRADVVERLTSPGAKRVLELVCGSGIVAGTITLSGHTVVAVDIVEACVASARRVATQVSNGEMRAVEGDFYEIELESLFDMVCYFDGFGIGSDADQRRLLRRIAGWLKPDGWALIDVYSPWIFANDKGEVNQEGNVMSRSDFDAAGNRLLESIWPVGEDESQAVTQSLRCYSPADFRLLLQGTGLAMDSYEPYESTFQFERVVPLREAEIYLATLVHEG